MASHPRSEAFLRNAYLRRRYRIVLQGGESYVGVPYCDLDTLGRRFIFETGRESTHYSVLFEDLEDAETVEEDFRVL